MLDAVLVCKSDIKNTATIGITTILLITVSSKSILGKLVTLVACINNIHDWVNRPQYNAK
jgi:hypothetical protein